MRTQRTLVVVVFVFAAAALALAQAPAKAPAAGAQSKAAQAKLGTAADETAVRALADQYVTAYNANDVAKAASLYAENAVFVDGTGKAWEGRAQIQEAIEGDGNAASRATLTGRRPLGRRLHEDRRSVEGGGRGQRGTHSPKLTHSIGTDALNRG